MKRLILTKVIFFAVFCSQTIIAESLQSAAVPPAGTVNTLDEQFNYIKQTSNKYEDYKVIKESRLNDFWKQVQDSIQIIKSKSKNTVGEVEKQRLEITTLKDQIENNKSEISNNEFAISNIFVFGVPVQKDVFAFTLCGIILITIVLSIIFYLRYKTSKTVTNKTLADYEVLQNEYTEHKKKCREVEMKLKRELQTARNTVEELSQVIATQRK